MNGIPLRHDADFPSSLKVCTHGVAVVVVTAVVVAVVVVAVVAVVAVVVVIAPQ